jgi:hypothetical protein
MDTKGMNQKTKEQKRPLTSALNGSQDTRFSASKAIVLLTTLVLISIAVFLLTDNYRGVLLQLASPERRLSMIWAWDIERLQQQNRLPKEWSLIRTIKTASSDPESKRLLSAIELPNIPTDPTGGEYDLEIRLISWTEGPSFGVIVQYELFKVKDLNKIWELGRTFELGTSASKATHETLEAEIK